jgi:hypothetical protein
MNKAQKISIGITLLIMSAITLADYDGIRQWPETVLADLLPVIFLGGAAYFFCGLKKK